MWSGISGQPISASAPSGPLIDNDRIPAKFCPVRVRHNDEFSHMALVLEILLGAVQVRKFVDASNQGLQPSAFNVAYEPLKIATIALP